MLKEILYIKRNHEYFEVNIFKNLFAIMSFVSYWL